MNDVIYVCFGKIKFVLTSVTKKYFPIVKKNDFTT